MALEGSELGDFRILREIGRGGMGIVYLAEQRSLGRRVAIKVLPRGSTMSTEILARFRREAEAASRLDHPGIWAVIATGVQDGIPFIAIRDVEVQPHSRWISSRRQSPDGGQSIPSESFKLDFQDDTKRVDPPVADPAFAKEPTTTTAHNRNDILWATGFIERAARALQFAHEARIIHRDIKPGNVMVTPEGAPVLLDFGLARSLEGSDGVSLTQSGDLMGTPHYMSAEQLSGQGAVDGRTDVYSLGVTLYELVTGRRPFEAPNRERLYRSILHDEPPSVRKLCPLVERDLEIVIHTAIERDLDRRYQTAEAFADDLKAVLHHEPIAARSLGPVHRARKWARRHPATAVSLVSIFVLLASGLFSAWNQAQSLETERNQTRSENLRAERALEDLKGALKERDGALTDLRTTVERSRALRLAAEAQALAPTDPALALALAKAAAEIMPSTETDRALRRALAAYPEMQHFPALSFESLSEEEPAWVGSRLVARRAIDALLGDSQRPGLVRRLVRSALSDRIREELPCQSDIHWESRRVVTASEMDGSVPVVWDLQTGRPISTLASHLKSVASARFSPDGRTVLTAGNDGSVLVHDAETGVLQGGFDLSRSTFGRRAPVELATFGGEGRFVMAVRGTTVHLWNTDSRTPLATQDRYRVESGPPLASFHPLYSWILGSVAPDRVLLWTPLQKGSIEVRLPGQAEPITAFGFGSNQADPLIAVGTSSGRVSLHHAPPPPWTPTTAAAHREILKLDAAITDLAFSHDSSRLLVLCADGHLYAYELSPGKPTERRWGFACDGIPHGRISQSADGKRIGLGTRSRVAHILDAQKGTEEQRIQGASDWVGRVDFSPDQQALAIFAVDGSVRLLPAAPPTHDRRFSHDSTEIGSVEWSPDGREILVVAQGSQCRVVNGETTAITARMPRSQARAARWSSDGRSILQIGAGRTWLHSYGTSDHREQAALVADGPGARLASETTRELLAWIAQNRGCLVVSPSGIPTWVDGLGRRKAELSELAHRSMVIASDPVTPRAVVWSEDHPVTLVDFAGDSPTSEVLINLPGSPESATFDDQGERLALQDSEGRLLVFDLPKKAAAFEVRDAVCHPVFCERTRQLAVAGAQGHVRLFGPQGEETARLQLPAPRIERLLDIPNRGAIACFGGGEIWVVQTDPLRVVSEVRAHSAELSDWDLCPSQERIVLAYTDGTLEFLHLDPLSVARSLRHRRLSSRELEKFELETAEQRNAARDEDRLDLRRAELRALFERNTLAPSDERRLAWARRVLDPLDPSPPDRPEAERWLLEMAKRSGDFQLQAAILWAERVPPERRSESGSELQALLAAKLTQAKGTERSLLERAVAALGSAPSGS